MISDGNKRPEPEVIREAYSTVVELLAEFIDRLDDDDREYYLKCQLESRLQELAVNDVLNSLDQIEEARRRL